ncbi:SipW-dependent-type signal peptide-containing protein [Atopococcus tabaci]|uniref:SipW-dependent-type signal peptide-containing protein n=1 Tax=Atopococcus tabaci TaxID=269774 RepID=UPI0004847769|nr:SipW-dependent-type signal peptide-containing protein [Atopococcus tabaci]
MNKNQNHRNKLPLILAALLTLALVAYGTFAYFTDNAQQKAGLKLTLGSVQVEGSKADWIQTSNNTEVEENQTVNSNNTEFRKVLPGDEFTNTFTFTNDGDNKVKITELTDNLTKDVGPFNVTVNEPRRVVSDGDPSDSSEIKVNDTLEPGEKFAYKVTVSVKTNLTSGQEINYYNNPANTEDRILDLLEDTISVTVEQANKPTTE